MELVQNANDQGASKIRFGMRRRSGQSQLMVMHNGDPITVSDALAMCFAFVSTKRNNPKMTGKFGIGLKTLSRLADRLEVHCSPYHFAITGNEFEIVAKPRKSKFYDPQSTDTLLVLPLRNEDSVPRIRQWVKSWDAGNMVFLSNLRELSWVYLRSGKVGFVRRLTERRTGRSIPWRASRRTLSIEETELSNRAQDQNWIRYDAEVPVPKKLVRAFKETGKTTTVSVAVPSMASANVLYAGLPTKISLNLPYIIGAAFDPNTARTAIQQDAWNRWLWKRVAGLIETLCLYMLEGTPAKAWQLIPASDETSVIGDDWVEEQVEDMRTVVWKAVHKRGRIATATGAQKLSRISYEEEVLDDLLTSEDFSTLAPKHTPLPSQARDRDGRWRSILDDMQIGKRIDVLKALDLLPPCTEQPLARSPGWYVRLVCEALDGGLKWKLNDLPCVLADDPVELLTPKSHLFSSDSTARPLVLRLGLVRKLHDSLLAEGRHQEQLRRWLEESKRLWYGQDARTVLEAITQRGTGEPLELSDDDLVELRDVIDELHGPDQELLHHVGQTVVVDAYEWVEEHRAYSKATVDSVYLPPAMSEADGWPMIAGRTPGLKWAAPRYVRLLDPGDRQSSKPGARRLLGMLGALNVFRLAHHSRRPLKYGQTPVLHDQEFRRLKRRPEVLRDDYTSPDLESVLRDICSASQTERSDRGLALIGLLDRHWQRSLQPKSICTATYFYYRERELGDVSATWIARLAGSPWLYNEEDEPSRPLELTIRSSFTQGLFGDATSRFANGIKDDLAPGLVSALGFEERPEASAIVDILAERRASGERTDWFDVHPLYTYLSELCPASSTTAILNARVGDITVKSLRGRFGINSRARGLVAVDGVWKAPTAVWQGRKIFGRRRSFVPTRGYENLWNALAIREPSAVDCATVLQEIASDSNAELDAGILADTLRHVNSLLELGQVTPKDRRTMASVPLWSGSQWMTQRPVYYIADGTASQSLANTHPMWNPPCSLEGLDALVSALHVIRIPPENCTPMGIIDSEDSSVREETRNLYSSAVEGLKDFLAKNQPEAYGDIDIEWTELSEAAIVIAPSLSLEISLPDGGRVNAETNAHIIRDPLTLCVQDESLLYDFDAGARVISQCFSSTDHQQMVRLAWSNPSVVNQAPSSALTLADDPQSEEDSLVWLKSTVDKNVGKPFVGRRPVQSPRIREVERAAAEPRRLKSIDSLSVIKAEIVNADSSKGKQIPERKVPKAPTTPDGPSVGTRPTGGGATPTNYTDEEREQLALQVLEGVVQDNETNLKDFTRLRGVGADAGDSLGRLFEVKAHGGEMPDSVNIELSQVRAANESPGEFYLAVISGLEEGYETTVRLFAQPMKTLNWEKGTSIKLSGIRSKKAIEVHL